MAVIKNIKNYIDLNSLFEDPTPGSNYIYFQADAYYKDTLAPLFDVGLIYTTNGGVINSTFGYSGVSRATPDGYDDRIGGVLQLNGETTHVRHNIFKTANTYKNNLDISPFISMDTNLKARPVQYFTDGTNNLVISSFNFGKADVTTTLASQTRCEYWTKLNTNAKDLYSSGYLTLKSDRTTADFTLSPSAGFSSLGAAGSALYGTQAWPLYRNPASGNLVWAVQSSYNNSQAASAWVGGSHSPIFSANPTTRAPTSGYSANKTPQFVGVSKLDFNTIHMHQDVANDGVSHFYKYQDASNTFAALNSFTSGVTAAGSGRLGTYNLNTSTIMAGLNFNTSSWYFSFTATNTVSTFSGTATVSGSVLNVITTTTGTLATGMTITQISVNLGTGALAGSTLLAGSIYTGTVITSYGQGTNQGGYRDTTFGTYIPKFGSKTFTDLSTSSTMGFYMPFVDTKGGFHPLYYRWNQLTDNFTRVTDITMVYPTDSQGSIWSPDTISLNSYDVNYGMQRLWATETFMSSGTQYLILMQLHGAGGLFDTNPTMRTFPTYSIDTSTYKTLTYTGKIEVPATPKNIVWLNDERTILGIFCHANFYIYTFSSNTGWTQTGNYPFQFNAVGRDNLGRIWAQDTGAGWGRLHLLTLNVPITISVTSTASNYYFAGTAVSTNITVNAYNYSGSRIATAVKLVIDGGSMTFAGSNLTITVTTSASADTLVPVTITGGGVSNVIASAVVS